MKHLLLLGLLSILPAAALAAPPKVDSKVDFYVSPQGNDSAAGSLEHPFATLTRAQTALRALRASEDKPVIRHVVLRGGFYPLATTLALTAIDSNTVYSAYQREKPVLSGGGHTMGWHETARGRWETHVDGYFSQLYVNGQRRTRPRMPKAGYYFGGANAPHKEGTPYDRLGYVGSEMHGSWANTTDIEVLIMQSWSMARLRLQSVDEPLKVAQFTGGTYNGEPYSSFGIHSRYLVENVKEALSEPGEWYLDRPTGILTYLAKRGEKLGETDIVAPRLTQLLTIDGAKNITMQGLTFAHASWVAPPQGYAFYQAEMILNAAVAVVQSQNIGFANCAVRDVGCWGISFGTGSQNCRVQNCELTDLGAGGIKIGEGSAAKTPAAAVDRIVVEDCLIAHGGRIHPAGIGVWIGHAANNLITHNEIADFYYTAVSPGWSWGYQPTGTHDNEICWNHIHDIGQGVLSDMGGIYTLGVSPGTTVHHNKIHGVESFSYGGWGIYFDEGTTGVTATDNLVYDTKSAPFHQHYGKDNIVRNNILALGREAQLMRTRTEDHLAVTIEHNIIYWREGPLLGSNWDGVNGRNFTLRENLYWNPVTPFTNLAGGDTGSVIADPRFADPERGDFTLLAGSPASRVGFVPFDLTGVGRHGHKPDTSRVPRAFPPAPGR